ncbi:MAG: outer membrane lipoprotein carrier protein LolA [Calditrichaeota bacterium]|nr:MAG: outer membrane lipoprotein carrier protein LolA [Calditrichota bacterium]
MFKNKYTWKLLLIILIATCATQVEAGEKVQDIVKKLKKRYEKFASLQADFTQTTVWALAGDEQSVRGKFLVMGNDKYRVETEAQTIVTNGKDVWTFSHEKNQVVINSLSGAGQNKTPRDMLIHYTKEFDARLDGEHLFNKTKCYKVIFTPRDEEAFVVRTSVLIDKKTNLALRIEQEDINENITRYELENYKIDLPLKKTIFQFKIPADAEVVDMR